ncbi:MAG: sigma-70 family RNA polymerase sigma factor [gamma proteobacterium endosymbiont of Lamellibrachia anaximandri]|nr:sigma-70 family RNA polymerase sigma factor [gamma proteobacterium endosymbiont of Lamellibrachia anaximandri]MBL3533197.1 sigma-70 family RNA polymerase sigma factor [gamma proteobacterium endosymbiont of Lamellibrachia anaximandri]
MSKRRFDVEALMANFMEGDTDAFESLYERYKGRIYRYVVRHCGTGEQGRLLYQKFWTGFVEARALSPTPRHLKTSLYRILHRQLRSFCQESGETAAYPVGELVAGDDGVQWGVLLIDLIRSLSYRQRESFLFRYEIGLNCAAIALVLGESGFTIEERIRSAEQELAVRLAAAGCADTTREALKSYYSETRRVKPPVTWDRDILQVLPQWLGEKAPQEESNETGMQTGLLARGFSAAFRRLKSGSGALANGLRQSVEPAEVKMPLPATNQ